MDTDKLYKITRKILEDIIKASDSRIQDTMDYRLSKAIERAKTKLEVLDELTGGSPSSDLTAPGPRTIPTPPQGPNTITISTPGQPQPIPSKPYTGDSSPWIRPTICEFTEAKDQSAWPPESREPVLKKGGGLDPFESGTSWM